MPNSLKAKSRCVVNVRFAQYTALYCVMQYCATMTMAWRTDVHQVQSEREPSYHSVMYQQRLAASSEGIVEVQSSITESCM